MRSQGGVVNNVSDLHHMLDYLHAHGTGTVASATLVTGTAAFNGSQLPLDTAHPIGDPVGGTCGLVGC